MDGGCFVRTFLNQGTIDFYDQHLKGEIFQLQELIYRDAVSFKDFWIII